MSGPERADRLDLGIGKRMSIEVKRVYDEFDGRDGYRVLVDRVWPRGMTKEEAGVDRWLRDIAPSTELRRWFGHDPEKFPEFARRYRAELDNGDVVGDLQQIVHDHDRVTLLYSARDRSANNAIVLRDYLR